MRRKLLGWTMGLAFLPLVFGLLGASGRFERPVPVRAHLADPVAANWSSFTREERYAFIREDAVSKLGLDRGFEAHVAPDMSAYWYGNRYMTFAHSMLPAADTPAAAFPSVGDTIPGARGWGYSALNSCSRSTIYVYKVSNTSANVSGSIDWALDSVQAHTGNNLKIVEFTKEGWFDSNQQHDGQTTCTYIAGQTAGGGGAHIMTYSTGTLIKMRNKSHDIVIRHLTVTNHPSTGGSDIETVMFADSRRNYLDHMNFYWNHAKPWGILAANAGDSTYNSTVAYSLSAQSGPYTWLGGMASTPTADSGRTDVAGHLTVARSGFIDQGWRNIYFNLGGGHDPFYMDVDNDGGYREARMVGNLWANVIRSGPEIFSGRVDVLDSRYITGGGTSYPWLVACCSENTPNDTSLSIYVDGVIGHFSKNRNTSQSQLWYDSTRANNDSAEVRGFKTEIAADGGDPRMLVAGSNPDQIHRTTPITDTAAYPFQRIDPGLLVGLLVGTDSTSNGALGDNAYVSCNGTWTARSDSARTALLAEARDSAFSNAEVDSAYIANRYQFTLAAATVCTDADNDGIPDAFETRYSVSSPTADEDGDGYSDIEEAINGSSPNAFNGAPTGGGAGSGGAPADTATYETSPKPKFLAFLSTPASSAAVRDTFEQRGHMPSADSIPWHKIGRIIYNADSSKALIVTCDTVSGLQVFVVDSPVAKDSLAAWGRDTLLARDSAAAGCG